MAQVVQTDGHLRGLLRTARNQSNLTQDTAAQRAGVTQSWWKHVENYPANVREDTLVAMLAVAGVRPASLHRKGYKRLASLVSRWLDLERDQVSLEDYLAAAPAPEELRATLVAVARSWDQVRGKQGRRQREPFAVQFMPPARSPRYGRQEAQGNGQHDDEHGA